ncbi:hypothetical protein L7F22_004879 [Adiantum nelumboides]|nr:hypothetical protein [Adiantum nelumboides]
MLVEVISPNAMTYDCILKAYGFSKDAEMDKRIHDDNISQELLKNNVFLGTALVDMHAKCGVLHIAHKKHEEVFVREFISWCALVAKLPNRVRSKKLWAVFNRYNKRAFLQMHYIYKFAILKACGITKTLRWAIGFTNIFLAYEYFHLQLQQRINHRNGRVYRY